MTSSLQTLLDFRVSVESRRRKQKHSIRQTVIVLTGSESYGIKVSEERSMNYFLSYLISAWIVTSAKPFKFSRLELRSIITHDCLLRRLIKNSIKIHSTFRFEHFALR